ncbi:MAG: ErfK/YbiS/YcfS/YnhG family protein, partial [Phenylobacterium sp.]|nr:ErfK/YbiS/YcfS/YnhG family protein [Phenylobacterium sp.]
GLVRLEVMHDRAGFSPGVIDGKPGGNLRGALGAYAAARNLPPGPDLQKAVFEALAAQDPASIVQAYQISPADLAGPFIGQPPKDYALLAQLPALGYADPQQALAEKFHMDRALLAALNPGVEFTTPGVTILVAAPRPGPRHFSAARVEVEKDANALRVYGPAGDLVAYYPASVGSAERPAPSGVFAVKAVAPRPAYYYDPKRLTFAPEGATGKLKIAPGPNNPVGSTWISLTAETYGIHGSPDPTLIGKHQSHGCVRLTNWDAAELGQAVKKGVEVDFVGQERSQAARPQGRG